MIKFIASFLGTNCEIVLHDTSNIENSIIAIENNHISGRQVGGSLTDLAINILNSKEYLHRDYLEPYRTKSRDGLDLHSSTYFIKDDDKELIGMICVNLNVTDLVQSASFMNAFISSAGFNSVNPFNPAPRQTEKFATSLEDLTTSMISDVISGTNIPPSRMTAEEKMHIVNTLNKKGVFLLKGAVADVAEHLETSEATIYRYLNKGQN